MGAFAAMKLAANGFRAKTEAIIAISPLINGQQHIDNVIHVARRAYFNAETSGFWDFSNEEGEHTKYPHEKFIALKNYNLETEIPYLTMPVHFIASNMDKEDHISDLRAFVGQLPTSGTFHNIENSSVTFSNTQRKFRAALTVIAERINPAVKPIDPSYVLD